MMVLTCPACGCEVEIRPRSGERFVECPDCDERLPVPKLKREKRPARRFDPRKATNRMWCPDCQEDVTASRENSERFNTVFGVGWVVLFALGCGFSWHQAFAWKFDWELVGILFVVYLSLATGVCAVIADLASRQREFRCKRCGTETEPPSDGED